MEYNAERCAQHGEQLHDLESLVYGNGNDGVKLELQRLKDWREVMERQIERRERRNDQILAAIIIQIIIVLAATLIPILAKL